jgi:hypothetical protein
MLLKPQEPPLNHPDSSCRFTGHLVSTPGALNEFGIFLIVACYQLLQDKAVQNSGIDYLQVFTDPKNDERRLWLIDGGEYVTALLPEDY